MSHPEKISLSKSKKTLTIRWDDGLVSEYPLSGLRAACPCAECKGGHENMGDPGSPDLLEIPLRPSTSAEIDHLEVVGNYALQITWRDGHNAGIYTWPYLRGLAPGEEREG